MNWMVREGYSWALDSKGNMAVHTMLIEANRLVNFMFRTPLFKR
jgi:hypothetical protein